MRRLTAHEQRMERFAALVYAALRTYQDRPSDATSGVSAGLLTIDLTTVFDRVQEAADSTFKTRSRR